MTRLGIRNSNNGLIRLKNKKLIFIINIKNDYYFVISRFSRNDKPDENIIMKMIALAPIEVEILLFRGSEQKIETDSGISS